MVLTADLDVDVPRGQSWDAARYAANGRFVATMATAIVDLLNPRVGEEILDMGCGDGALTEQLAATGAIVRGCDASEAMVAAARERGLAVDVYRVQELPYDGAFDAVFSNAALHWIPEEEQGAALGSVYRALRPGGRFVAEMGGLGNIASIRTGLTAVLAAYGLDPEALAASFYPSAVRYRGMLEAAGFRVNAIHVHPRATPLPGGADGMANWLTTFRNGVLDQLGEAERAEAISRVVELLRPALFDSATDSWTADYVRLRFHARKD